MEFGNDARWSSDRTMFSSITLDKHHVYAQYTNAKINKSCSLYI